MITTCVTNAGRLALLRGEVLPHHKFKVALYTKNANLDKKTKNYTIMEEVQGGGYTQLDLPAPTYGVDEDDVAFLTFAQDMVWKSVTVKADGCMIYDATLDNLALVVVAFDETVSSTNDSFTLSSESNLIRFG